MPPSANAEFSVYIQLKRHPSQTLSHQKLAYTRLDDSLGDILSTKYEVAQYRFKPESAHDPEAFEDFFRRYKALQKS